MFFDNLDLGLKKTQIQRHKMKDKKELMQIFAKQAEVPAAKPAVNETKIINHYTRPMAGR